MSANLTPTCPTNCNSLLPSDHYDFCKPTLNFGEIEMIYLAPGNAECFTDWALPTEWLARISDTAVGINYIRRFAVIGDQPAASNEEIPISLGRKVFTPKTFTLNLDIDDTDDLNYAFFRTLECNEVVKLWYKAGNELFGGNCGLDVSINANYTIERGRKTLHKIIFTVTWEDDFSPERVTSPI